MSLDAASNAISGKVLSENATLDKLAFEEMLTI
jgi:hypothetical protein